jgi:hypothetical protein
VLTKPSHATVPVKSFISRSTYSLSQAANGLIAVLIESGGKIHVLGARGGGGFARHRGPVLPNY